MFCGVCCVLCVCFECFMNIGGKYTEVGIYNIGHQFWYVAVAFYVRVLRIYSIYDILFEDLPNEFYFRSYIVSYRTHKIQTFHIGSPYYFDFGIAFTIIHVSQQNFFKFSSPSNIVRFNLDIDIGATISESKNDFNEFFNFVIIHFNNFFANSYHWIGLDCIVCIQCIRWTHSVFVRRADDRCQVDSSDFVVNQILFLFFFSSLFIGRLIHRNSWLWFASNWPEIGC